jgi:hypothetical protein
LKIISLLEALVRKPVIPSKEASCFIQDITERKLAEKDCKELNTKLEIRNRELYDSIIHIQKINTNVYAKEKRKRATT